MTNSVLKRRIVEFYTSSPRLTLACRQAAKLDPGLARLAKIRDLAQAAATHDTGKRVRAYEIVVLSHAEDGPLPLIDSRLESVISGAFHLLLTGPATHPDQVAQWIRSTNVRSENRLHVMKIEDINAPPMLQLLTRVCFALEPNGSRPSIIDAYLVGDRLFVRGPKHRMLHIPINSINVLRRQPQAAVRNFAVDSDGSFVYWPDLNVHLGWNQFLQALDPAQLRKAQQRSAGFNERYGAAIREFREANGIFQSEVEGLTERQLRRIEHGECRATSSAIAALAKAHRLDPNAYMERLTKAMR